jgi:hypothetical protein
MEVDSSGIAAGDREAVGEVAARIEAAGRAVAAMLQALVVVMGTVEDCMGLLAELVDVGVSSGMDMEVATGRGMRVALPAHTSRTCSLCDVVVTIIDG